MNTTRQDELLLAEVEKLATRAWALSRDLAESIRSFAAAMRYNDPLLEESCQNSVFEALAEVVDDVIQKRAGSTQEQFLRAWERISEILKENPREDVSELAVTIRTAFDKTLENMSRFHRECVGTLSELGHSVPNAPLLERDIEEVQKLRQKFFENWPSAESPLPPADRAMVARSRAERALRDGETFEDMLRRVASPRSN